MKRALLMALLLAGCGGAERNASLPTSHAAPPPNAATPAAPPDARESAWQNPEPAEAQARAEAVVAADFNRDKTTRLVMNMTTIQGQTSSLSGWATQLASRQDSVDARLARLHANVTDTAVVIQLPGAILFDFDSANIRPDAVRALDDVAQVIRSYAQRPVRVEGHTDSIASDDYNHALSQRRAQSVVDWLASHGVEHARLSAAGFGESKPVASNDTAAGRQKNRRVEVVIARK
jgi:outer membrane protein OmpA-like peptidoglycan-associated protein